MGIAIHAAAETYIKGKAKLSDLTKVAATALRSLDSTRQIKWQGKRDFVEVRQKLWQQAAHLRTLLERHDITPGNSQAELSLKWRHPEGLTVAGRIDVLKVVDGGYRTFDIKGTYNHSFVDVDQFGVYYMLQESAGYAPAGGAYLFTSDGTEQEVPVDRGRNERLLRDLYTAAQMIKDGNLPELPNRMCIYCDFKDQCPGSLRWERQKFYASSTKPISWGG